MLKLILITLLTISLSANSFTDEPENRYEHIALHTGISAVSSAIALEYDITLTQAWWIGFGVSAVIGIGKEVSDTNFDWNDVGANTIGGVIGATGMYTLYTFQSGK